MTFVTHKDRSRIHWGKNEPPSNKYQEWNYDNVILGCLQRIADATEVMAKNYTRMQSDLDNANREVQSLRATNAKLQRSRNALSGLLKRRARA